MKSKEFNKLLQYPRHKIIIFQAKNTNIEF